MPPKRLLENEEWDGQGKGGGEDEQEETWPSLPLMTRYLVELLIALQSQGCFCESLVTAGARATLASWEEPRPIAQGCGECRTI